jgi:Tfp pilus assembly protein PilE
MKSTNLRDFRRYLRQAGQGMTEYIIIVAVIAIGSIAVYTFYGEVLRNQTAAASVALSGEDGKHYNDVAEQVAIVAGMEAGVGKSMENFSDVSTAK